MSVINKKGFIDNIFLVIVTIVSFFVILLISMIYGNVKDGLNGFEIISNNTDAQETFDDIDTLQGTWDWLYVLFFFGLVGAILLTLYSLRSSPLFFVVGIIGLFITVFLAILLTDGFGTIIDSNADISNQVTEYPKSNFIFDNLPVIILIIICLFLVVTYIYKGGGV